MKSKLNYSAQQILYVYGKVKQEQNKAFSKITLPVKCAFGGWRFQINDIFEEKGRPYLKYKYVGYGGVDFLGNINGKSPTMGLYYKSASIKKEIETFIITMQSISDDKADAVNTIRKEHGEPEPQYCLLWDKA